jgi:hypothetical protein
VSALRERSDRRPQFTVHLGDQQRTVRDTLDLIVGSARDRLGLLARELRAV